VDRRWVISLGGERRSLSRGGCPLIEDSKPICPGGLRHKNVRADADDQQRREEIGLDSHGWL